MTTKERLEKIDAAELALMQAMRAVKDAVVKKAASRRVS